MKKIHNLNEYATAEHALMYLSRADSIPHRTEGEAILLEFIPQKVRRILDLGSGDGRLLALLKIDRQEAEGIALDFSPTMIKAASERFSNDSKVQVVDHNMDNPLPDLGQFDVIVSSFAIHHCTDERKRQLYSEVFNALLPGGVFCNLEHVKSPTNELHKRFIFSLGLSEGEEDPSNKLLDVETQLQWLRDIGFQNVDCYWKWLELALIGGSKSKQKK
jgi:tRNA (cmo5U34)-methyltransferase